MQIKQLEVKSDDLENTRKKLQDYAHNLQVPFKYCSIMP
jgi:hypothetical protein